MKNLIFIPILFVLTACQSETKIDLTNPKTAKESIENMRKPLSKEEKFELAKAIDEITFANLKASGGLLGSLGKSQDKIFLLTLKGLDGKTREEILALGEKYKKERIRREIKEAKADLKKLQEKKERHEKAMKKVTKIDVLKSKFWKKKDMFQNRPYILVKVKNGTDKSISRIYFEGTLSKEGRKVPYLVQKFNYNIPGGLEPGESKQWTLAPNPFSDWGRTEVPKGVNFSVEVEAFDDHKKKRYPDYSDEIEERDLKEIAKLELELEKLKEEDRSVATNKP